MKKREGSAPQTQQIVLPRWIKLGQDDDGVDAQDTEENQKDADDDGRRGEESALTSSSSAPPSCYSMAAAAAAKVVAAGVKQKTCRTTGRLSCRSTSQLSSYDLATALQTINHLVFEKSMRLQKATHLVGPEDLTASPRKRTDQVLCHHNHFVCVLMTVKQSTDPLHFLVGRHKRSINQVLVSLGLVCTNFVVLFNSY